MFTIGDNGQSQHLVRRKSLETIDGDDKNCQNVYLSDTAPDASVKFLPQAAAPPDTIAIDMPAIDTPSLPYQTGQLHPSYGIVEAGRALRVRNDSKHPEIRWWKLIHIRSNADYHEVHIMYHLSDASTPLYLGTVEGRPTLTVAPRAWYISTSAEIPPMSWRLPPLP